MKNLMTKLKHEIMLVIPPTLFFFIAFMLIIMTQHLILQQYHIPVTKFTAAIVGALIVGKVVLITDNLSFINKFPQHPLIYNIAWKSSIYFVATLLVRYIESLIEALQQYKNIIDANQHLFAEIVWSHFWLIQVWLAVLFFVYTTLHELVRVIGKQEMMRIFFGISHNSSNTE